jgi:hypothetical protein
MNVMKLRWAFPAVLALPLPSLASTLHVPADHAGIQEAIDAARDGDTVLVAPGEYVITEALDWNRLHDPDDPASPGRKDITVRSEAGPEATTVRMASAPGEDARATVVIFENGESERSVLQGFTLSGGRGTFVEDLHFGFGGGVFCLDSSPSLVDLKITGNIAGGVHLRRSAATLTGCEVSFNGDSGVFCAEGSSALLIDCTIQGHRYSDGGGIHCEDSSLSMIGCRVLSNASSRDDCGGGLGAWDSVLDFTGCTFLGNVSGGGGGAMCLVASSATLTNCLLAGNKAVQWGGAIQASYSTTLEMVHCTITGNEARYFGMGGAVGCYIDDEPAPSSPLFKSCIVWENVPDDALEASCGAFTGSIADRDPLFVRPGVFDFSRTGYVELTGGFTVGFPDVVLDAGDYRLLSGSPAIDLGVLEGAPGSDITGAPRPCGAGVDAGAYELCDGVEVPRSFRRGDVDGDGGADAGDAVRVLASLFLEAAPPLDCEKSADSNDDGRLELLDPLFLLNFLFQNGRAPPAPLLACAPDPTPDRLPCGAYPGCG